ncbi:MAG: nucleotidyl transferase AbiEii/AbiGii toxin family protein [Bacteroidota bacterium]
MIGQNEIRRIAGSLGVDPMIINHNYVLGCFMHFLSAQETVKKSWVFKGGTSLAKCYFENYRFSEDLDFTLLSTITEGTLITIVDSAKLIMQEEIGIRTDVEKTKVETISDEYGEESLEARFYYRGPWDYAGSPRSVQIHTNRDEKIVFPTVEKSFKHGYSDDSTLPYATIQTYSLEEILVEKVRAFSGQRRYALSRDIFDIHYLSLQKVDISAVIKAFEEKCRVKDLKIDELSLSKVKNRKEEYRTNWKNQLEYLIPKSIQIPFDEAWAVSVELLGKALGK